MGESCVVGEFLIMQAGGRGGGNGKEVRRGWSVRSEGGSGTVAMASTSRGVFFFGKICGGSWLAGRRTGKSSFCAVSEDDEHADMGYGGVA